MNRTSLLFTAPYQLDLVDESLPALAPDQLLVQTHCSAISPGTEMLFYRGQTPPEMSVDSTLSALANAKSQYPLRYGYACVGRVVEVGQAVDCAWLDRLVFAFHPHTSHLLTTPDQLLPVPDGLSAEQAAFYPNMETAVTFLLDGHPALAERVAVFGQGVVGLLTTALLARFPLAELTTIDPIPLRRQFSMQLGAHTSLSPQEFQDEPTNPKSKIQNPKYYDLVYELSSQPATLNDAIACTGFGGRVVIGSWYGQKQAPIDLGGHFHRNRIKLIGSQVSTIAPEWSGRWDRARRAQVSWEMLQQIDVRQLITHQVPIVEAATAYRLIDERAGETVQVLLRYD